MKGKVVFFTVALLSVLAIANAQEVLSFRQLSSSTNRLPNGNIEIVFVADLNVNVVPLSFNFHWQRSDGATSPQKVARVGRTSESAYRLEERWTVGPRVDLRNLWEKVYVNSGNTRLVSEPIMANAMAESAPPPQNVDSGMSNNVSRPAPGAHPAYLHALSDLRLARGLLGGWSNPLIIMQCQQATREIEDAIGDVRAAAIDDGKNIEDHPGIDASLDNRGRLIQALELLNKAYKDIDERETNPADSALRSKALGHISRARQQLGEARRIARWL